MRPLRRIRQGLRGFRPNAPFEFDNVLATALNDAQRAAFLSLPHFDQDHLLRVYLELSRHPEASGDVRLAGLLHDIGKVAHGGRVHLWDRTLCVLLGVTWPSALQRLARLPAPKWRLGIALAVHHPALGAEIARDAGCSDRVCWLIEHHAAESDFSDPDLALLMAVDDAL